MSESPVFGAEKSRGRTAGNSARTGTRIPDVFQICQLVRQTRESGAALAKPDDMQQVEDSDHRVGRIELKPLHREISPVGKLVVIVLEQLSDADREVLVFRHVTGLSLDELASTLDLKLSAAKMRLSRARTAFVAQYDEVNDNG